MKQVMGRKEVDIVYARKCACARVCSGHAHAHSHAHAHRTFSEMLDPPQGRVRAFLRDVRDHSPIHRLLELPFPVPSLLVIRLLELPFVRKFDSGLEEPPDELAHRGVSLEVECCVRFG